MPTAFLSLYVAVLKNRPPSSLLSCIRRAVRVKYNRILVWSYRESPSPPPPGWWQVYRLIGSLQRESQRNIQDMSNCSSHFRADWLCGYSHKLESTYTGEWPLSCLHSVMMVSLAQLAEGGGPCRSLYLPPPLETWRPPARLARYSYLWCQRQRRHSIIDGR